MKIDVTSIKNYFLSICYPVVAVTGEAPGLGGVTLGQGQQRPLLTLSSLLRQSASLLTRVLHYYNISKAPRIKDGTQNIIFKFWACSSIRAVHQCVQHSKILITFSSQKMEGRDVRSKRLFR